MNANTYPSIFMYVQIYSWVWPSVKVYLLLHTLCSWEFLVMSMRSKFACVYFCSLGFCDWCWLQHLLFIVLQLHTWISMWVGDEVPTPIMCQNVYFQNVYCAKMSTVPKCLLSKCAKMSTVAKCCLPKCLHGQNVYCAKMSTPKMSTV